MKDVGIVFFVVPLPEEEEEEKCNAMHRPVIVAAKEEGEAGPITEAAARIHCVVLTCKISRVDILLPNSYIPPHDDAADDDAVSVCRRRR